MEIAVGEAAALIGVDRKRVLHWLHSGELPGRRLGAFWLVDADAAALRAAQARPVGRPMAPARAWGLLDLLDGGDAGWLSPVARSQVRALIRDLVADPRGEPADADRWRHLLRARRHGVRAWVHPAAVARVLRDEAGPLPAGPMAAAASGIDLVAVGAAGAPGSAGAGDVEHLYLRAERWEPLARRWHVQEGVSQPNLLMHLPRGVWPFEGKDRVGSTALAADLLESAEPRAVSGGLAHLRELARRVKVSGRGQWGADRASNRPSRRQSGRQSA